MVGNARVPALDDEPGHLLRLHLAVEVQKTEAVSWL